MVKLTSTKKWFSLWVQILLTATIFPNFVLFVLADYIKYDAIFLKVKNRRSLCSFEGYVRKA